MLPRPSNPDLISYPKTILLSYPFSDQTAEIDALFRTRRNTNNHKHTHALKGIVVVTFFYSKICEVTISKQIKKCFYGPHIPAQTEPLARFLKQNAHPYQTELARYSELREMTSAYMGGGLRFANKNGGSDIT